jgi:hypothetical protein
MSRGIHKSKLGISLMLSYVILIAMGISLSILVFVWMKTASNVSPPVDCNEGTSIILESSSCIIGSPGSITLNLKNNGRFNVSGVLVSFGDDVRKVPVIYLRPESGTAGTEGYFFFNSPLKPGNATEAVFLDLVSNNQPSAMSIIKNIQIQPFIYQNKKRVFCTSSIIKQEIPQCLIK